MIKNFRAIAIALAIGLLPCIGVIAKIAGKQLGYFGQESYAGILVEFAVAVIAMACLVGLVLLCVGILVLKDTIATKANRTQTKG